MLKEHDRVVLTQSLPGHRLEEGDVGAIVFVHEGAAGYEVEFVTLDGAISQVVEVASTQVRPVNSREIPHARLLAEA